jgi:hypothetical protein
MTRNVCAIPLTSGCLPLAPKAVSSWFVSGDAISAPPPKPMIAIPVDSPGRSGNHLISVDTGEM